MHQSVTTESLENTTRSAKLVRTHVGAFEPQHQPKRVNIGYKATSQGTMDGLVMPTMLGIYRLESLP